MPCRLKQYSIEFECRPITLYVVVLRAITFGVGLMTGIYVLHGVNLRQLLNPLYGIYVAIMVWIGLLIGLIMC